MPINLYPTPPRRRIRRAQCIGPALAAGLVLAGTSVPALAQAEDAEVIELSTTSEAAKEHFWAGVEDSQNVFAAGALRNLEQAVEADPSFGLAHVTLAFLSPLPNEERLALMAEGLGLMDHATTDELLMATAFRAWRSGEQPDASRILAVLSRMNSDDPHALVWATQLANARGNRTDAAERQRQIIERFPDYAPPHNTLAYALAARGDEDGALEAVQDYLRLAPNHPNAHDSYAEMLQWSGRYQDALTHYGHAVGRAEGYEAGYTGAAEVYVLLGEYEQAAAKMMEAAEHAATPQNRVNHLRGAASASMLGGNRKKALEALASAATFAEDEDLGPAAGFAHLQAAVTAALMGQDREIGAHLTRAGEVGPQNPAFHGMSALAHGAAGHVDAARASAAQIPESNANWTARGHTAVALALVEQGDLDGAMEELSSTDPGDPLAGAVRGLCLDKMGRDAEASTALADVINLRQFALANPLHGFAKFLAGQH